MSHSTSRRCRICHRPLALIEEPAGVCHRVPCQQARHQQAASARQQARDTSALALYRLGVRRGLVAEPERFPIFHVPAQDRSLGPLPEKRRRAFEAHLDELLAASERPPVEPVAPPPPAPPGTVPIPLTAEQEAVSIQGCIGCRGACCQTGSTHAWQDLPSIRRYRELHPTLTRDEIRADYLARLNTEPTFVDSCVYHGAKGCLLPREMRSWRCNTHWCGELRQVQRQIEARGSARVFMVWAGEGGMPRGAFVDPTGSTCIEDPDQAG